MGCRPQRLLRAASHRGVGCRRRVVTIGKRTFPVYLLAMTSYARDVIVNGVMNDLAERAKQMGREGALMGEGIWTGASRGVSWGWMTVPAS